MKTLTTIVLLAAWPALVGADETLIPPEMHWTATPPLSRDIDSAKLIELLLNNGVITAQDLAGLEPGEEMASAALQLASADASSVPAAGTPLSPPNGTEESAEYDPWERFNDNMFRFNRQLDRFFLKPLATVWDTIVPDPVQRSLGNAFDNVGMPRRLVNNLLQGKGKGAGRELARFFLNTTMGIGGFFDVATELGIEKSSEDTGQTLGVYGVRPGPYLVLPLLPPLTVRDGIGFAIDGALDPLSYILPFAGSAGRRGGNIVNERSLTLELFQEVEESAVDLYAAVRNGYLQRRQKAIEE